jgi:hypothetical protein
MKCPLTHCELLRAEAQYSLPVEHEEHFLVGVVIVEGKRALARRNDGDVVPQLAIANAWGNGCQFGLEAIVMLQIPRELQIVDVNQRSAHRSISPKTMSWVPMMATTSAIM